MRNILKSKHFNTQAQWLEVWNNYQKYRTKEEIETLVANTVAEIKEVCKDRKPALAWSGGKDSIALEIVCELAGITKGFCCYNDLYFTKSIEFFKQNAPSGVIMYDSGEDVKWVSQHMAFLFPKGGTLRWNNRTHLRYQPIYCRENDVDLLLMGKRSQDGNWVPDNLINIGANGVPIYCPIREWKHEDVICAIRYYNKSLSPIYFSEDGFHYGDTKFVVMSPHKGEPVYNAWDRIYKIEPEKVVESAFWGIKSAQDYLNERELRCRQ